MLRTTGAALVYARRACSSGGRAGRSLADLAGRRPLRVGHPAPQARGDSLFVRQSDSTLGVPVAHIKELRLIRKSEVGLGGGGQMAGAMNALVGGDDEVYDLTPLEFAERIRTLQKILLMHPPAP